MRFLICILNYSTPNLDDLTPIKDYTSPMNLPLASDDDEHFETSLPIQLSIHNSMINNVNDSLWPLFRRYLG